MNSSLKLSRHTMKFNKILLTFCFFAAASSCTKQDNNSTAPQADAIRFGIEEIAETRLAYDEQDDSRLSARFTDGNKIGLYAFFNNFYYFYPEYSNFAESVIFANQDLTVRYTDQGEQYTEYSPIKSWTFSTIYGTAPHTLDVVAYYPQKMGYNPDYVVINHSYSDKDGKGGGAATLKYFYVSKKTDPTTNATTTKVNFDIDFMTAHTRYDDSKTPLNFRNDMLSLSHIPLRFTRQTASLNLKVTKPDYYEDSITVKSVTAHFKAYQEFDLKGYINKDVQFDETTKPFAYSQGTWSNMSEDYLTASIGDLNVKLEKTNWTGNPQEGAERDVENLLPLEKMFHFPTDTDILKVVFTILDGTDEKTYVWHPHIAPIVANTHYTLHLELDPKRAN